MILVFREAVRVYPQFLVRKDSPKVSSSLSKFKYVLLLKLSMDTEYSNTVASSEATWFH